MQRRGVHLTLIVTENLPLKRFERSSPQGMRGDSHILYPFRYRATHHDKTLIIKCDVTVNVAMVISTAIHKSFY